MRIVVLGAAAGGGLPQWNCNCVNCVSARDGGIRSTQTSLALTSEGSLWALINASPDLRQQLTASRSLHPASSARHSPIGSVILTNAEVDAVAGLLSMREGTPFMLYADSQVLKVLQSNSIFNVLGKDRVKRVALRLGEPFEPEADGRPVGIEVVAFAVEGKEALYLEGSNNADDGSTLGLTVHDRSKGTTAHIVTACARVTNDLVARLDGADAIFFDGTLWRDDELIATGLSQKTGQRMGHVAMDGPDGAIARLSGVRAKRKIFIHINNSNPVWQTDSIEREAAERAGWEIGFDGMEIVL